MNNHADILLSAIFPAIFIRREILVAAKRMAGAILGFAFFYIPENRAAENRVNRSKPFQKRIRPAVGNTMSHKRI
jgi:hypothetical protein